MPPRLRRSATAIVAVVWAALLIPLGILAFADTALNDAVSIVDRVAVNVLHLYQSPQNDSAKVTDNLSATLWPLLHAPEGDLAHLNDSVTTNVLRLLHSPQADAATVTDLVSVTFLVRATTTSLGVNANPSMYGSPLTITATVTSSAPKPGPGDGTVTFKDGGTTLCGSQALIGNQATCITSALSAGAHTLSAEFSGGSRYGASSGTMTETVSTAPLTISAQDASKVYGAAIPAFAVSYRGFVNGDTPASLGGSLAFATSATVSSGVGAYPVTPSGLTSTNYAISFASGTLTVTPKSITATATDASRFYGQPNPAFDYMVSGLVNGDSKNALGTPVFTTSATQASAPGAYPIVLSGLGNPNYTIAYVNGTLHVVPASTATALTSSPNPSFIGAPVTLTATVTSTSAGGLNPSSEGTVTFRLGSESIGSAPLDASGHAVLTTSTLPVGHDLITATYSGDANFIGSASAAVTQVVKGNKIAFSSARDGNFEIYSMNANGSNQLRLTTNPAIDTNPAYSSDGTKIAFVSSRGGLLKIWVMNADGTNPLRVTSGLGIDATPAWSADGTQIFYSSLQAGHLQLWAVNADGTNQHQFLADTAIDTTPAASPDGSKIAYTRAAAGSLPQIYVVNADGTNPHRLVVDAAADATPAWSPDGRKLAFTSSRGGLPAIYVLDLPTSTVARITSNGLAFDATPSWSPDGSRLAFTTTIGGHVEVWAVNADGTNQAQLTTGSAINALPSWCCTKAP